MQDELCPYRKMLIAIQGFLPGERITRLRNLTLPAAVETKKPDVPDELPTPSGDGEVGAKKAELPASMT